MMKWRDTLYWRRLTLCCIISPWEVYFWKELGAWNWLSQIWRLYLWWWLWEVKICPFKSEVIFYWPVIPKTQINDQLNPSPNPTKNSVNFSDDSEDILNPCSGVSSLGLLSLSNGFRNSIGGKTWNLYGIYMKSIFLWRIFPGPRTPCPPWHLPDHYWSQQSELFKGCMFPFKFWSFLSMV